MLLLLFSVTCTWELTEPAGEIKSIDRNNDGQYDNNLDCSWTIHMAPNKFVEVTFVSVELEESGICIFDYLEVRNTGSSLQVVCGLSY